MSKKGGNAGLFNTIAFVLFIVWGLGTLLNLILGWVGVSFAAAGTVKMILDVCAMIVMVYCAYLFYSAKKSIKLVFVLFWISAAVAICVVVLPFII